VNNAHSPGAIVDQRQAETLARLFNMAYNSAMLYGGTHQTTQESAVPLFNLVKKYVDNKQGMLSIIVERESVFVENFCVDKIINARRLVLHFKKAGLQSISFETTATLESMRCLLAVLCDMESYPTADDMKKGMMLGHAEGIRLNYVVYRKMTVDEAIVNKDAADFAGSAHVSDFGTSVVSSPFLTDVADLVSIKHLLEQPQLLEKVSDTDIRKTAGASFQAVLGQLRTITSQIKNKEAPSGFISGQELAQAVYSVKKEVSRNISSIKASIALEGTQSLVIDELETMSQEAILRIVREEYRGGTVSIKRLSQIIRRIVPDVKDLKRMLPRLKETLLAEGMEIADFLKLVTEIRKDLDSDGIAALFEGELEEIGVSMEELIATIKEDPADAARLLILASEIRKKTIGDTNQVAGLLTDYVERVSRTLSLESKEIAGTEGIKFLKTTISTIQKDLVEKLRTQGIPENVLKQTDNLLSSRLTGAVGIAKKEWIDRLMSSCRQQSETELLRVVPPLLQNFDDTTIVKAAVTNMLTEKGYSELQVKDFFDKAAPRQSAERSTADLPKGVLNVNATVYFLEREIKRQQRYGTPFSCIIVTPRRLWSKRGAPLSIGEHETRCILPQVVAFVRKMLRDLDLVGSLGFVTRDIPFVILPMTDEPGASSVVVRLEKAFSEVTFECNKEPMTADFTISCSCFNPATMSGYRPYLEFALTNHKKKESQANKTRISRQPQN
jgi:hypothetical protein